MPMDMPCVDELEVPLDTFVYDYNLRLKRVWPFFGEYLQPACIVGVRSSTRCWLAPKTAAASLHPLSAGAVQCIVFLS